MSLVSIRYRATMSLLAGAAALLLHGGMAVAQTVPKVKALGIDDPKTVMYVGNSFFYFNNSMHRVVQAIVTAGDPKMRGQLRSTSITMSGSGMNWHDLDAYFRPGGVASYSFVGENEIVFNKFDKPFDVVIMMDCSQCPIHPKLGPLFHESVRKNAQIAAKNGAKPALFMSWAYADKPEMTAQLAEQYTKAGNDNDALVIPAGLAFARALAKKPDLVLYDRDKRHPSLQGTYVAASTIYASLYGRSPVGNPFTDGIDPATAKLLQEAAWEATQEYYGKR
jgi:hypothetical protein